MLTPLNITISRWHSNAVISNTNHQDDATSTSPPNPMTKHETSNKLRRMNVVCLSSSSAHNHELRFSLYNIHNPAMANSNNAPFTGNAKKSVGKRPNNSWQMITAPKYAGQYIKTFLIPIFTKFATTGIIFSKLLYLLFRSASYNFSLAILPVQKYKKNNLYSLFHYKTSLNLYYHGTGQLKRPIRVPCNH